MKNFFAVVLLALLGVFVAGCKPSIDTNGIPANSAGILCLKFQDGGKSKSMHFLRGALGEDRKRWETEFGVNIVRDVSEITAGFLFLDEGNGVSIVLFRGTFPEVKFKAGTAKFGPEKKSIVGNYTFLKNGFEMICLLNETTLLLIGDVGHTGKEREIALYSGATAAIAAFEGKAKSYAVPEKMLKLSGSVKNPLMLVSCDGGALMASAFSKLPFSPTLPIFSCIAFGDDGTTSTLRVLSEFNTPEETQQFLALAQMGIGFAQTQFMKPSANAEAVSLNAVSRKILSSVKYEAHEKTFSVSAECASADVLDLLTKTKVPLF
jgi:hypothetical protein